MCGICGYIDYKGSLNKGTLNHMVSSIRHRGPDDNGTLYYEIQDAQVGMGHARLSILDLTPLGHQPMEYANLSIVFNGEIYNFKEIRFELEEVGHRFISNSDTEVILHAFKEWGKTCVSRFIGMFAFAIFDKEINTLYLCRDRAGVKPLYYYINERLFAFASELKPLMAIPTFNRSVRLEALSAFLKVGYIPGELSIFENTFKVDAGYWLEFNISNRTVSKSKYWDIEDFYLKPKLNISYEDAKSQLKVLFKSAFGYRLVADVPIGVLLSGGFDSSAVTSILVKELGVVPQTFTVGFRDFVDEVPDTERISGILGTKHETQYCTQKEIKDLITTLPYVYDEPFADTSALPTIMVSQLVKKHVSVVLSADGGDELFAGYDSYSRVVQFYNWLRLIPNHLRQHYPYHFLDSLIPHGYTKGHIFVDQLRGAFHGAVFTPKSWYDNRWCFNQFVINGINPSLSKYDYRVFFNPIKACFDGPEYALVLDWKTQMKDEYLVKIDRAMMSVSLEGREPMLDHRIAEFVSQLPWEYKFKNGVKKRIIKDLVYDYLPKDIMDKPKRGFSPPVMQWLRSDLKDYLYCSLSYENLRTTGFDYSKVQQLVDKFMSGDNHYYNIVWRLIQYNNWHRTWVRNSTI